MRRELELMAQIDDFLDGNLSKNDLEQSFSDVKDLEAHIDSQSALRNAMKKKAFLIQSKAAFSKLKLMAIIKVVVISIIATSVAISATIFSLLSSEDTSPNSKTEIFNTIDSSKTIIDIPKKESPIIETKQEQIIPSSPPFIIDSVINFKTKLTGVWTGNVNQGENNFFSRWTINKIDSLKYSCTSLIRSQNGEFAEIKTICKIQNGALKFKEKRIIKDSSSLNDWCLKQGLLKLKIKSGSLQLSGKWDGTCESGTISLVKTDDQVNSNPSSPSPKINGLSENTFTIQTMRNKGNVSRDNASPTKTSDEINMIKGFLNTKEYDISLKKQMRFKMDVFDKNGKSILDELFVPLNRKTDAKTFRQNISISYSLRPGKKLPPGNYTSKIYYWGDLISTKSFIVY